MARVYPIDSRAPKAVSVSAVNKASSRVMTAMTEKLIGQDHALRDLVPFVQLWEAGLAPAGRPVGVFMLLGPSGCGKTRTVEVLAEALHGSEKNVLQINCGEFQMEHEIARLIGAPPGYLGHKETSSLLTQTRLNMVSSESSKLSLLLFDEIEKAAPSFHQILLGILDKGRLNLGDNTVVNFDRTLIFMTSNVGSREIADALNPAFGFQVPRTDAAQETNSRAVGLRALKRKFKPEFLNRIDRTLIYSPLTTAALEKIMDIELAKIQEHIDTGVPRPFKLAVSKNCRAWLLDRGTNKEFGARELRRVLQRYLVQPLAALLAERPAPAGATVTVTLTKGADGPEPAISVPEVATAVA